jgi:predicted phage terminase large subunit-like protein
VIAELLNSKNLSLSPPKELEITEETIERANEMVEAERSLKEFTKQAWHVVEPVTSFVDGWHLDAICDHLEAARNREIRRLIINVPPRHMKSLECSVFFPCWVWLSDPSSRWLYSSYAQDLSTRDSLKCRRLIQSLWYQARWNDKFTITSDQNQKMRFENDKTGVRLSTSVDSLACGEGGDYIMVDDPHNTKEAESELKRNNVLLWWNEVMSSRLNNPHNGVKIIVMQRLNENDLTGHILEKELDYIHLMLPAEFERGRRCKTPIFIDPRTKEGEPLWEGLYDKKALGILKKDLVSEYAIAGQLQQRPAPRGGGMFQIDKFQTVGAINEKDIIRSVRYWDKAGTEDGGAFTAGALVHKMVDGSFIVADRVKGQWSAGKRERIIRQTAEVDGKEVNVWVEQEPGSGGKESAENTIRGLAGYRVRADKVTGAKEVRAEPYANQVEIGNVFLKKAEWNRDFIHEHESFPVGKYKDSVDATAGAFNKLIAQKARVGTWGGKK